MIRRYRPLTLLALVIGLGACASRPPAPVAESTDPAAIALARAVDEVQRSWNQLAMLERARDPSLGGRLDDLDVKRYPELGRKVYFPWDADLRSAVEAIGGFLEYEVVAVGRPPVNPIVVHSPGHVPMPIGDILRDLSAQAGRRATVVLKPNWKRIEVVYTPEGELIGGRP